MADPNEFKAWEEALEAWKERQLPNFINSIPVSELVPCHTALYDDLVTRLNACSHEFFLACNFTPIVLKCPGFDPAMKAFEWERVQIAENAKTLATRINALEAKLGTNK